MDPDFIRQKAFELGFGDELSDSEILKLNRVVSRKRETPQGHTWHGMRRK